MASASAGRLQTQGGSINAQLLKAGLIVGVAIILATGLWIYFSPFNRCVRAFVADGIEQNLAERHCAPGMGR
jgi:hypothetical protein